MFPDMVKRGNLNNKLYKNSLKFVNLKRCEGEPQFDADRVPICAIDKVIFLLDIKGYQKKFEIQLLGVTYDDTAFT